MGLINWIKGVISKMFKKDAKNIFSTDVILSSKMETAISEWYNIIKESPEWVNKEDDIETINFAKFITSDVAKKICIDIGIKIDGSTRADYLQNVMNATKKVLRDKVEDACGLGGIMFKPNGSADVNNCIDYILPTDFLITDKTTNGDIRGVIFFDYLQKGDNHFTRMEYHRFVGEFYVITNKAYKSSNDCELGKEISLKIVEEWSNIQPEVSISKIDKPLFAYYKMPYNNTIDYDSPLGVSVYSNAIKELKALDIAWSRKSGEIEDSKHITFVDSATMTFANQNNVTLPRFIKAIDLDSDPQSVREHTATLLTDDRISDMNNILNMLATKIGFSQGTWSIDGKTGLMTATQVEAEDRETIETIKDMRDSLKSSLEQLLYAIDVYASLYNHAPLGKYEVSYAFGDLTYNWEEDRVRHWNYVVQGKYPLYRYYMKFEGMSEEQAKQIIKEAKEELPKDNDDIFGKE